MRFLKHITVTFVLDKMMRFLPEKLIYLKNELTIFIKPMSMSAVENILIFVMKKTAAVIENLFVVNPVKKYHIFFFLRRSSFMNQYVQTWLKKKY